MTSVSAYYVVDSCDDSPLTVVDAEYRLTQNIQTASNCIDITGEGIYFNLYNNQITVGSGYGVRIKANGVSVKNGEIDGQSSGRGISFYTLNADSDITIEDVKFYDGEHGIYFPAWQNTLDNITIKNIEIYDTSSTGIIGEDVYLHNSTFQEIFINNSGDYGLKINPSYLLGGSYNTEFKDIVIKNTNSNRGFTITSQYSNFTNINTDGFYLTGFYLTNDYNRINNLVSNYEGGRGIELINTDHNQFNNFYSTGSDISLYLSGSSHNQFINGNLSGSDTYDVNLVSIGNDNNAFLDVDYDISKELVTSGDLTRKWYFNAEALYSNGTAINQSNITAYNSLSSEVLSVLTDSTGMITPYYENLTRWGEHTLTPGQTKYYYPNVTFTNQYVLGFSFLIKDNNTGTYNPWHGFPIEITRSTQNSTPIGDGSYTWYCDSPWFSEYSWCGLIYNNPIIIDGWVKWTITMYNPNSYNKTTVVLRHAENLAYKLGDGGDRNTLIEYINDGGSRTYQTPHTINVSKTGWKTNSTIYNLTETQNVYHQVILNFPYGRSVTQLFTITNIIDRIGSLKRDIPQLFTTTSVVDRLASLFKTTTQSFTIDSIIERIRGTGRAVSQVIKIMRAEVIYDFSGVFSSMAFNHSVADVPPLSKAPAGETEFTNYTPISASDDDYVTTLSYTEYPYQKYEMVIEEADPEYVDFLWEGHTSASGTLYAYVWNYTANNWSLIDSDSGTTDFNLTAKLYDLNNIRQGTGNVTFLVQAKI